MLFYQFKGKYQTRTKATIINRIKPMNRNFSYTTRLYAIGEKNSELKKNNIYIR
jgi:hypothetical protein